MENKNEINNDRRYVVYKHTNKVNGKCYIGMTGNSIEKRWANGRGYQHNAYFNRAILKYGWGDGFVHEIIADNLTKDEACNLEIKLIEELDTCNPNRGYNSDLGGTCEKHSQKVKQKMSENHADFNGVKHPRATPVNQYDLQGNFIKTWDYVRQAAKELGLAESSIYDCCSGKKKRVGNFMWRKFNGNICNIEPYIEIQKAVICVDTGVVYKSIHEASRLTGIGRKEIANVCKHRNGYRTAGNFIWRYASDIQDPTAPIFPTSLSLSEAV